MHITRSMLFLLGTWAAQGATIDITGSASTSGFQFDVTGSNFGAHSNPPGGLFPFLLVPCLPGVNCTFSSNIGPVSLFSQAAFDDTTSQFVTGALHVTGSLFYTSLASYSAPISITGTLTAWSAADPQRIALFTMSIVAQGTAHPVDIVNMPQNLVQLDRYTFSGVANIDTVPEPSSLWLIAGALAAGMTRWRTRRVARR